MKRIATFGFSTILLGCMVLPAVAQSPIPERDSSTVSLFEYTTKIPKRSKAFNLDLQMHATFNTFFTGGSLDEAAFRFNHIKLEASGEINDRLFYLYRQNLNQGNEGMELENLPESLEYAFVGFHLGDRFTITAGKQDAAWGGFEYDIDPFSIYEYSEMNEYKDCYFTGVTFAWHASPSQELRVQVTDNRIGSMEDAFGLLPEGIRKAKAPLYYTLNWNSSYFDELLNLRYSATAGEQARGKWSYLAWAGHNVSAGNFNGYFDVMYTRGALDPLGILSELIPSVDPEQESLSCIQNVQYLSLVAEASYRFHPKWNVFAKGMYETGSIYKASEGDIALSTGKYRTALGYQAGIEFYPMADENLHIFLTGTGRTYSLTQRAQELGAEVENMGRISVGFIYKLPLF